MARHDTHEFDPAAEPDRSELNKKEIAALENRLSRNRSIQEEYDRWRQRETTLDDARRGLDRLRRRIEKSIRDYAAEYQRLLADNDLSETEAGGRGILPATRWAGRTAAEATRQAIQAIRDQQTTDDTTPDDTTPADTATDDPAPAGGTDDATPAAPTAPASDRPGDTAPGTTPTAGEGPAPVPLPGRPADDGPHDGWDR